MMEIGGTLLLRSGRSIVGSSWIGLSPLGHPMCSQSRALVLSRSIDSEGRLVTKRLHVIYQDIPACVKAIIGDVVTYAGEESIVDPKTQTLTLRTKNLSLNCFATVDELCVYKPSAADPSKTEYSKKLSVQGGLSGLLNLKLENWFISTDNQNRSKGINVMNEILGDFSRAFIPLNPSTN